MTCAIFRRRLLGTESPGRPPDDITAHLAQCGACREWHLRLLQVEAHVARLPVPRSDALAGLLERVVHGPRLMVFAAPAPRSKSWRGIAAAGIAASLLIAGGLLLGSSLWNGLQDPGQQHADVAAEPEKESVRSEPAIPKDVLVAHLIRCDVRLAKAGSSEERIRALADLADGLQGETQVLAGAAGVDELDRLAVLYGRVIRQGVVARAGAILPKERTRVLAPIVAQLERVGLDVEKRAKRAPGSAAPLRRIVAAAHEGEARLRDLMGRDS